MGKTNAEHLTDEKLVESVRGGDVDNFGLLVSRYQNKLFAYIYSLVREQEKAKDILQEAFIKMYQNIQSFDCDRSFSAWAYRICHNEAINYIKKFQRESLVDDNWLSNLADEKIDLGQEFDTKQMQDKVKTTVYNLPTKYQQVLLLYYYQDNDYEKIAAILNIPASSVGTRLRRAKAKLKKQLATEGVVQ